ncbi:hypothetical protein GUITHDRAFT_118236 [Guillardia theta CCMP2712]|uniref:Uncharacterized protein n=1 Tax=Guillardia theta (strain CCMP2712) TaxID=905079 RepID=L1IHB7_GUITC|nr:hypothetical protein GUITHDRAFT_118236 [Guillardia theta CCMP2712]EKX35638.1 hypothetical protein GUITHDRAFT_118236 [Guillardia theta CCMP2712]|eukprot:XP_005822618.1 hypothetical protein GUITHDRAFT_118236 [Guillardia theta CCMP2712]
MESCHRVIESFGGEPEDQPDLEQRQLNPTDRELNDGIPCWMDLMVAPLAHMFCYTVNLQSLCNYYRFDYARRSVDTIATLVNDNLYNLMLGYASIESANEPQGWYAYDLQPGVASFFYPHTTLYAFSDASQIEIPMKWWVQCILLHDTVDVTGFTAGSLDVILCVDLPR